MTKAVKLSKQAKLHRYLATGAIVTRRQAAAMFKLKNPSDAVANLRKQGVKVEATKVTLKSGIDTTVYSIFNAGKPTRKSK